MRIDMKNCDLPAIITALGGRRALQDLLGVGPSAISNYLARGALPQRAHAPVCEALRARGWQIDPGSLALADPEHGTGIMTAGPGNISNKGPTGGPNAGQLRDLSKMLWGASLPKCRADPRRLSSPEKARAG